MTNNSSSYFSDFIDSLAGSVEGEIRTDHVSRVLYSTDASIYQVVPQGIFFPRDVDEISAVLQIADEFEVPIIPRGGGSGLAGQAIGAGLIIDCSRHLDQLIEFTPEDRSAVVGPGLILSELNRAVAKFGLQFGPDPASDERATFGGIIGNNATGAHSIRYGMTADHLPSLEISLSDGSTAIFSEIDLEEAAHRAENSSREGEIYKSVLSVREKYYQDIVANWPKTWRRASGYNLNYLLPWSPSNPPQWYAGAQAHAPSSSIYPPVKPGSINLAALIAGSEGSLGVIRRAKVRLVEKPRLTSLVLMAFADLISACDSVPTLLEMHPSAVELIPSNMVKLARNIPSYASQIAFLDQLVGPGQEFPNLLAVEFAGEQVDELRAIVQKTRTKIKTQALVAEDENLQRQVWNVRKVGLGILMSIAGDTKPIPFVEDVSVPVNKLSQFVSEFESILQAHETRGDFYAHASAGCLHMRPLINLKAGAGVNKMRVIAKETIDLISHLGGAPSGEHGDGFARSEWLEKVFGPDLIQAFKAIKVAADPKGLLNPGKIVDPDRMDQNLRYGVGYSSHARHTVLDFSNQGGYAGAIEMCNGAGVCRKLDGVMCPSFQATQEEMHSTRGRANLLRAMLTNQASQGVKISPEDVFQALDLCIACKGCKSECPSAVDMAKIKYEFLEDYYQAGSGHRHPWRDYLFGYIDVLSRFASFMKPVANYALANQGKLMVGRRWLGISSERSLPTLNRSGSMRSKLKSSASQQPQIGSALEQVLFLLDPFTEYYQPDTGIQALQLLDAAGCQVHIIPVVGSGRTKLSKGFTRAARQHAEKVVAAIGELDRRQEMSIIGIEPSEIYMLRDEYPDFFPGNRDVSAIARRAYMLDEYLLRPGEDKNPRYLRIAINFGAKSRANQVVYLHGHCYQKTQPPAEDGYPVGLRATSTLLQEVGYTVEVIESGCCGMAGAFGYEAEHYDLSMRIGDLSLFPSIQQVPQDAHISSAGFSCMSQIKDGTGREAMHFVSLLHTILSEVR